MGRRDDLIAGRALPKCRLRRALFELPERAVGVDTERAVYRRNIGYGVQLTKTAVTSARLIAVNRSRKREAHADFFAVTARRVIH